MEELVGSFEAASKLYAQESNRSWTRAAVQRLREQELGPVRGALYRLSRAIRRRLQLEVLV